jgi:hypothetical protein
MTTATLPTTNAGATTETNASGRTWGSGPYVRKGEREDWNALYLAFAEEFRRSRDYPQGARLTNAQIDVLAYNCAYTAIWHARED